MWDRVTAGLTRLFRRAMPGHDEMGEDFFDYITTTLLTTYRAYARPHAASLIEGVLRRHPEGGARRGVLRRRLNASIEITPLSALTTADSAVCGFDSCAPSRRPLQNRAHGHIWS